MPTLVLGGAGFIGTYLVEMLVSRGESVRVFDLQHPASSINGVEYVRGDILDPSALAKAMESCSAVYHLAAQLPVAHGKVHSTDERMWAVNVEGTARVLDAMGQAGIRKLIYTSTVAVYGIPAACPIGENTPVEPAESYGASKLAAEALCRRFAQAGNDVVVIRPCPVIGPRRLGIFQILFEWIYSGWNVPILGRGDNVLQFVDVEDCADAILRAGHLPVQLGRHAVYNVGADDLVSLRAGLEAVIAAACSRSKVRSLPKSLIVWATIAASKLGLLPLSAFHAVVYGESVFASTAPIHSDLGWAPRRGFIEILLRSYQWYRENRATILAARSGSAHQLAPKLGLLSLIRFLP